MTVHAHHLQAVRRANAAADAVERIIQTGWWRLNHLLKEPLHWAIVEHAARLLFSELANNLAGSLQDHLQAQAHWSAVQVRAQAKRQLPKRLLVGAALAKVALREAGEPSSLEVIPAAGDLLDILFPPPSASLIAAVVFNTSWQERLAATTRLAPPEQLARAVAAGVARGDDHRTIMQSILPLVDNVRSSARRVARTESMRVMNAMQLRAHEQLGDLVVGYQLHATLDHHTRWWHRQRHGTIYYLQPERGQKGPAQMPSPPDEPADPRERPPGTPRTAPN